MGDSKSAFSGDRIKLSVLLVFGDNLAAARLKTVLSAIGLNKFSTAATHVVALEKMRQRNYSIIIFDAKPSDMPPVEFAKAAVDLDPNAILLPLSKEPDVDDVFSILRVGALGFIVDPYTIDTVESSIQRAHDGPPLSNAVLEAKDRNAALTGLILHSLYRLCRLTSLARRYKKAAIDREAQYKSFKESIELARLFCNGGDEALLECIIDGCIKRANVAATRLGRTRRRLQNQRVQSK